jgi:large subunit ribosomal protein L4
MSSVKIIDQKGAAAGAVELPEGLLAGTNKGSQALHDVVVATQNGLRAGTASSKGKGAVAGSGKKPWKQKGTGRARAGYRRSPVWKGGGVAFGPMPRSYAQRLPKKVIRLAFRRAFTDKVEAGALTVLDSLTLEAPKTKLFAALMKELGVRKPALFVLDKVDPKALLAMRNIPGAVLATAAAVGTFELVRAQQLVVTKAALEILKGRLTAEGSKAL